MSTIILLNESNASRRVVPLPPLIQSNGTSACTNESGRTFFFSIGGIDYGSGGSISAISANAGLYECLFSGSKVSVLGQGRVYYSSGTALPASTPIHVVPYDSHDSMRLGLFALPNSAPDVSGGLPLVGSDYGSLLTVGVSNIKAATYSGVTVGVNNIAAGTYSGVSIEIKSGGIQTSSIAKGNYSGVSFEILSGGIQTSSIGKGNYSGVSFEILSGGIQTSSIGLGTYSGVTVGVNNIAAGTYSGVSVEVKSGGIQTASIGKGAYSGVSVEVTTSGIQTTSIGKGNYSGVSVEILTAGIQHTSFGVNAVDAAALATDAGQEIADRILARNVAGGSDTGRLVTEAFYALRNRVAISGSTGTVYQTDDSTSAWTFSVTTVSAVGISDLNPAG